MVDGMSVLHRSFARRLAGLLMLGVSLGAGAAAADEAAVKRGEYIFNAADCVGCHTDAKGKGMRLAGGRPLATPFGTFYSPNITPDPATGIGKWSLSDFRRALRQGIAPEGHYYYPVFPFPAFTGMSDADIE